MGKETVVQTQSGNLVQQRGKSKNNICQKMDVSSVKCYSQTQGDKYSIFLSCVSSAFKLICLCLDVCLVMKAEGSS